MESKCILGIYIALLIISLFIQIFVTVTVFIPKLRYVLVKESWDAMSETAREQLETNNDCSGFEECYTVMEEKLKSHYLVIGLVSIGIFIYQLGLVCFTCFLCRRLPGYHYTRVSY